MCRWWLTLKGIGVCKEYFGPRAKARFLGELRALEQLRNTEVRTSEVMFIDVKELTLTEMFIPGSDLEQVLTGMGARLTGAACRARMGDDLNSQQMTDAHISEGVRFAAQLPSDLLDDIHNQVRAVHRHGLELYDIKYGNIIVHRETGLPYLVDFDSSRLHSRKGSRCFLIERDRDIERLNRILGTEYLTYSRLRKKLTLKQYPAADRIYASAYIGHGLRIGQLWDRSIGFGRWHYILRRCLRIPSDCRVLSIGVNNSSIEIQLLREGVAEVVAYEFDNGYATQGTFLTAACEWADNRKLNLHCIQKDMREAANAKGDFDCALALCSLYYLPASEMQQLASAISKKTPRFVLQCNIRQNIGREDPDEYRRASVEFSVNLLKNCGFTEVFVTAPRGYSRPIVDGVTKKTHVMRQIDLEKAFKPR